MKNTTSNRRLLKLADFLEKLPRKRFDYGTWVGEDWAGKQDLSCGTTACAVGWACTIPAFRRAGLKLAKTSFETGTPTFGEVTSFKAAAEFFELNMRDVDHLFNPIASHIDEFNATPKYVAKKIRKFVASQP